MSDRLGDRHAIARFWVGFSSPFRGLAFLASRPRLWSWVAAPAIVLTVALIPTASWAWNSVPLLLAAVWMPPPVLILEAMWLFAAYGLALIVFLCLAVVEWAVIGVLARPLYSAVAERVEAEVLGIDIPFGDAKTLLTDAAQSVAHSFLAIGLYSAAGGVIAAIALIPGVGEIGAPVIGAVVTAAFVARELLDGPLGRRRVSFAAKIAFLRAHWAETQGLGAAAMVLLAVPVLDLAAMPAAIIGATLLYCQLDADGDGVRDDA